MFLFKKYRLAVCVEYNGTNYIGWQKQFKKNSIQEVIENMLSKISNHEVKIFCASRTDLGVHSLGQIFHFDTFKYRNENEWLIISNYNLPKDIYFKWVKNVSLNFHSRYNAISRRYIYIILNSNIQNVFLYNLVFFFNKKLDINLMLLASRILLGENDFSSFRSSGCQSISSIRRIFYFNIYNNGLFIFFDIIANSFLYHMVRNIISSLLLVGINKMSIFNFKKIFYSKNKDYKFNLVKPNGLYLYRVYY